MSKRFDEYFDESVQINMTPLIDVVLVLLIIFMLTSSITLESGLDISIPKTKSQTNPQNKDGVVVSLDKRGTIYVEGNVVEQKSFEKALQASLKEKKSDYIILEGDSGSQLGKVIELMDMAKAAGATKFAIAAEQGK